MSLKDIREALEFRGYELKRENGVYTVLRSGVPIFVAKSGRELRAFIAGYDECNKRTNPLFSCNSATECIFRAINLIGPLRSSLKTARRKRSHEKDKFDEAFILISRLEGVLWRLL